MDVYKALVAFLGDKGFGPVYTELPHDAEADGLPFVDLQPVAKPFTTHGLNVLGFDEIDIDIDLYVSADDWATGKAARLAQVLRLRLHAFRDPAIRVKAISAPARRPDRNNKIRRLGMTVTVMVPAHIGDDS